MRARDFSSLPWCALVIAACFGCTALLMSIGGPMLLPFMGLPMRLPRRCAPAEGRDAYDAPAQRKGPADGLPAALTCARSPGARVSEGTLQKAALAHIVTGFVQRRPSLVRVAEKILNSCTVRPLPRSRLM